MLSAPSPADFILFGPFLKALRKQAGLSQEELGRAVNYTREYITLLERGKRNPDPTTVATLFVPALGLIDAPEAACRLIELAARARGKHPRDFGIAMAYERDATNHHDRTSPQPAEQEELPLEPNGNWQGILHWYVKVDPDAALDLANAMSGYWRANGQFTHARAWLRDILARSTSDRVSRGQALLNAAEFARHQGDLSEALALFYQSQQVFQSHGDFKGEIAALIEQGWALFDTNHRRDEAIDTFGRGLLLARQHAYAPGMADALGALAHVHMAQASRQQRFAAIQALLDEALEYVRDTGDARKAGFLWSQYAALKLQEGQPVAAQALFERAVTAFQTSGDLFSLAWTYDGLGECYFDQARLVDARRCYESALATFRASGGREGTITNLHHLGRVDAHEGKFEVAIARFVECLSMCEESGHPQVRARCLAGLGYVAFHTAREMLGVRLLAAADRQIAQLAPFLYPAQQAEYGLLAELARRRLGDSAFELAWVQGAALPDADVSALARSLQ